MAENIKNPDGNKSPEVVKNKSQPEVKKSEKPGFFNVVNTIEAVTGDMNRDYEDSTFRDKNTQRLGDAFSNFISKHTKLTGGLTLGTAAAIMFGLAAINPLAAGIFALMTVFGVVGITVLNNNNNKVLEAGDKTTDEPDKNNGNDPNKEIIKEDPEQKKARINEIAKENQQIIDECIDKKVAYKGLDESLKGVKDLGSLKRLYNHPDNIMLDNMKKTFCMVANIPENEISFTYNKYNDIQVKYKDFSYSLDKGDFNPKIDKESLKTQEDAFCLDKINFFKPYYNHILNNQINILASKALKNEIINKDDMKDLHNFIACDSKDGINNQIKGATFDKLDRITFKYRGDEFIIEKKDNGAILKHGDDVLNDKIYITKDGLHVDNNSIKYIANSVYYNKIWINETKDIKALDKLINKEHEELVIPEGLKLDLNNAHPIAPKQKPNDVKQVKNDDRDDKTKEVPEPQISDMLGEKQDDIRQNNDDNFNECPCKEEEHEMC